MDHNETEDNQYFGIGYTLKGTLDLVASVPESHLHILFNSSHFFHYSRDLPLCELFSFGLSHLGSGLTDRHDSLK